MTIDLLLTCILVGLIAQSLDYWATRLVFVVMKHPQELILARTPGCFILAWTWALDFDLWTIVLSCAIAMTIGALVSALFDTVLGFKFKPGKIYPESTSSRSE